MTYTVTIRRNADGETRDYQSTCPWQTYDDGTDNLYWWTEGNGGCDCNRSMCFAQAGGEPTNIDVPCGETAYRILRFTLEDGRIVEYPHPRA